MLTRHVHNDGRRVDSGLLADGGADMVHAVVRTSTVPLRPPTAIESLVQPVCDSHARIVDWELTASPTGSGGEHASDEQEAVRSNFHQWRATFVIERVLCERALARTFLAWMPAHLDVGVLEFLDRPTAALGPVAAIQLKWHIDEVRRILIDHDESAIGLFADSGRHFPLRGFIGTEPPTTLAESSDCAVSAGRNGLNLRESGELEVRSLLLTGWHDSEAGLIATDGDGDHLVGTGADVVHALAHGYPRVQVRPWPLRRLLAPLVGGLTEMADLAMGYQTGMSFYSGWRSGSRR